MSSASYLTDKITPLMCACKCPAITVPFDKSVKVVRLLVDAGADVNAINRSRMTPFIYAGSIGNLEAVIELIPLCNIHAVDNQGWHALFWAVQEEHYAVVKKLIETGLDTDRVDVRNQSVFSMAARHFEIKMLFPQYVEDPLNFDDWQMNSNVGDFNAELRHVSPNTDKVIFFSDVAKLIYGMNLKNLTQKLFDNGLDLYTILSLDKVKMLELGIVLPLQQYRLQHGLYRFHKHPYKPKSVNIIDCDKTWHTEDITTSIFNQIRHLAVMEASLQYLMNNSVKLAKTKDIRAIERRLKNLESLLDNIHKNVVQWDKTIMSVDRITAKSIRNIKSHSHFKTICVFGSILALSVYVYRKTWH